MLGDGDRVTTSEDRNDERVVRRDGAVKVRVCDLSRSRGEHLPQLELRSCTKRGVSSLWKHLTQAQEQGQ